MSSYRKFTFAISTADEFLVWLYKEMSRERATHCSTYNNKAVLPARLVQRRHFRTKTELPVYRLPIARCYPIIMWVHTRHSQVMWPPDHCDLHSICTCIRGWKWCSVVVYTSSSLLRIQTSIQTIAVYTLWVEKTAPFYFCNNFVKPTPYFGKFWQSCNKMISKSSVSLE